MAYKKKENRLSLIISPKPAFKKAKFGRLTFHSDFKNIKLSSLAQNF